MDGSSNTQRSGAGIILRSPKGDEISYILRFDFKSSKNKAEYKEIITGMKVAKSLGAKTLISKSDSQLVVN